MKRTGDVIGEFYDFNDVKKFNPEKCRIETAHDYLYRINQEFKDWQDELSNMDKYGTDMFSMKFE
jgi:hypothetical protein